MANEEQQHGAVSIGEVINGQIATKIDYLQQLQNAIADHDDCQVYQLLDNQRYAAEIEHREQQPNDSRVMNLVDNLADQLSNYLSSNLIEYLGKAYPFFYYEEYQTGHYRVYFGNWWDRRQFGELDVLNIRFIFNQEEYDKLAQAFKLSQAGKRYNSKRIGELSKENERLQSLIDDATTREQRRAELQEELKDITARSGIFESSRNRESRESIVEEIAHLEDLDQEARTAAENIKQNERTVLDLSKENTILSYEQKSINDVFGSFEDFELANRSLYANYLASLSGGASDEGKRGSNNE